MSDKPFQPLLVESVRLEARDVISVDLIHPQALPLPTWTPGAHLDLALPSGTIRSYSLCGDPADRRKYRVAVLRVESGRGGSAELHQFAMPGRSFLASTPSNHFPLEAAPHYLFLAGGIGVTPILAMARDVATSGLPWTLLYSGRSRETMAFVAELASLPGGELAIRPRDEFGVPNFRAALLQAPDDTGVYCCGSASMLKAVLDAGSSARPDLTVHCERFLADTPRDLIDDRPFDVTLARAGVTVTVPPGTSILDAVRAVRPNVMSSCREGVCSACETAVLAGVPDHRDAVLTPKERAANRYMMICVSRARSGSLTLDL